jgi:multiple sugar transport system ATP-binding protein
MTMATRIVVMKSGVIQQVDTPQNLYLYPCNLFVAGFIGSPQMNFFNGVLTGTKDKVYVEFGGDKVLLPKEKVDLIVGLDKFLNTGREIVFGIRPEDVHDDEDWMAKKGYDQIEAKVDVAELLGAETLLYCKIGEKKNEEEISVVDAKGNLLAKVDGKTKTKAGMEIKVAFDLARCQIFDKETEITIVAKDEANKAEIEALQARREEEEAKKAEEAAKKAAEEQAKLEAELEKKRAKLAKKGIVAEESAEETEKKDEE